MVCKVCHEHESELLDTLLGRCRKTRLYEVVDVEICDTCGNEVKKVLCGVNELVAHGRMKI